LRGGLFQNFEESVGSGLHQKFRWIKHGNFDTGFQGFELENFRHLSHRVNFEGFLFLHGLVKEDGLIFKINPQNIGVGKRKNSAAAGTSLTRQNSGKRISTNHDLGPLKSRRPFPHAFGSCKKIPMGNTVSPKSRYQKIARSLLPEDGTKPRLRSHLFHRFPRN
jgi:hypothetical protein